MKKIILLSSFFTVIFVNAYSQYGWIQQQSNTTNAIIGITFLNQYTGHATGWYGTILKSTNGGANWSFNNIGSLGYQFVSFPVASTGFIFGNSGSCLKTTDGGTVWYNLNTGCSDFFMQSHFINENTGWVVGYNGRVVKTTNSGLSWVIQNSNTTYNLTSLYFINANTGWITGDNGVMRETTDGGNNWMIINTGLSNNLCRIFFLNDMTGWVPGTNGLIMKTTNGGNSWTLLNSGVNNYLVSAYFFDANTGFICGSSGIIIKSTNGGTNWTQQPTTTNQTLNYINFINNQTGWVCGFGGVILKTTTSGEPIPAPPTLISPQNNSGGIPVTPTMVWSNNNAQYYKIQISTMPNFYVITDSMTTPQTTYTVPPGRLNFGYTYFWRVRAANAAGMSDWSSVWNFSTSNLPSPPNLISPPNGIVGTSLTPTLVWDSVYTANTYLVQVSRTYSFSNIIDSISSSNKSHQIPSGLLENFVTYFWRVNATNSSGTSTWSSVWSFTTLVDNLKALNNLLPSDYCLYQNYPNPFNPSTNIRFDVPKSTNVKLIVYDINGRTVESLFSGNVPAGSFEYKWNASKYASGLYFVKMESKDFTGIKKMTLIK